ncbi:Uncharacterised protein [Kingella potus]|uniref:DNA mimic protein DMP19 C-terminal domain-containing protein n=1 Tax=Kingella potus TaxID=265175 RepID=A0A377R052_9NEIS|nr:DUF4375 domain-containing protein [Kingella potus]UOP01470.1 DMP19 family protein [Kingella potus]STR00208.1 Uncharacterised protein [Kingella potus]
MDTIPEYKDCGNAAEFLYTLADHCFAWLERHGQDAMARLTDEQNTLMAYVYLDSRIQEGGFVQLIAEGYGGYIFDNPLADSLRRWKIKTTPRILDQAAPLYAQYGAAIETMAENGADTAKIRRRYPMFEELDGAYYDTAEDDMAAAAAYIETCRDKFFVLPD